MPDHNDDLLDLGLFTDQHRCLVRNVAKLLDGLRFPEVSGSGIEALRASTILLGEAGLLNHAVPRDGHRFDMTSFCLVRESVARRSVIGDLAFVMQALGSFPVFFGGTPELKERVLSATASGAMVAAFAITEPEAGSDLSRINCRAEKTDDGYRVNGVKHLISNAGACDYYSLFARVHPHADGPGGITCFHVPSNSVGIAVAETPPVSPHPLGTLTLRDLHIPDGHRLGPEGGGLKIGLATLARCRPSVAAAACGYARRALDIALPHIKSRQAFAGTLADLQLVQGMVAHSVTELDAARLLTYRCTAAMDANPDGRHDRTAGECKWFATEAAQRIIDRCVQMVGGQGVLAGSVLADLYNAIRPLRIYEGASEVQQVIIARSVLESA